MLRGRVLVGLLACCALAGCERREHASTSPRARTQADTAGTGIPAAQVCVRACERFDACASELAVAYEAEIQAVRARFPFACTDECARLEGSAQDELAQTNDCAALDSCIAFYTCASGDPPPPTLSTGAARTLAPTCVGLCARERGCRDESDPAAEEAEAACVLRCEAAPASQSPLPCASRRTCAGLVGCIETWRDSGYASELDAAPPGVSPVCDRLCTRAIQCGAQATSEELGEELDEAELAELRDTMTSTYMECALQCSADLGPNDRTRFEKCIGQAECKAFEECADVL